MASFLREILLSLKREIDSKPVQRSFGLLGVASALLSFYALWDAKTGTQAANDRLQRLSEQASTRPIGPFPDYVREIASLVSLGDSEDEKASPVRIALDCLLVGRLTASADWNNVRSGIRGLQLKGLEVRILLNSPDQCDKDVAEEFRRRAENEVLALPDPAVPSLQPFLFPYCQSVGLSDCAADSVRNRLRREESATREELCAREGTCLVGASPPGVFMVVSNPHRAIFGLRSASANMFSYWFQTEDSEIVLRLTRSFDASWKEAENNSGLLATP